MAARSRSRLIPWGTMWLTPQAITALTARFISTGDICQPATPRISLWKRRPSNSATDWVSLKSWTFKAFSTRQSLPGRLTARCARKKSPTA